MKILIFLVSQLYANRLRRSGDEVGPPAPPVPNPSQHVFTEHVNCRSSNDCDNGRNMCNFDDGDSGFCENCLHFRYFDLIDCQEMIPY